ncbi:MAG: GNAT family N-acetyltransferase [Desulfobacterales bacterium]
MADIDRSAWNALALPLETPLLEWDWLHLLEDSGSVRAETGWQPVHLTIWSGERLVAAAPLYAKSHSSGEFVFDHAWAHLAQRLGIRYYPKLVGMSPFSPVVGYRFLIDPGQDSDQMTRLMATAIDQFCQRNAIAGCSFLFVDPAWQPQMEALGFSAWRHQSYAWRNRGFGSFADYLTIFNANQRRNIRRERRSTTGAGIVIRPLTGTEITPRILEFMYTYYRRTNDRYGPWGCKYLTKAFFDGLSDRFRDRLLLMAAFDGSPNEVPIALSFLLTKKDRLYGRYWGSAAEFNHLHFDTCYYSPIEWAIGHRISLFDPGAGSPHKIRRGFEAVANHSLHRFYDPGLSQILHSHIGEINRQEQLIIDDLNAALPFSRRRRKSTIFG